MLFWNKSERAKFKKRFKKLSNYKQPHNHFLSLEHSAASTKCRCMWQFCKSCPACLHEQRHKGAVISFIYHKNICKAGVPGYTQFGWSPQRE